LHTYLFEERLQSSQLQVWSSTFCYELKLFREVLQKNKLESSCLHPLAVAFNCVTTWWGFFASFKCFYFIEAELINFLIRGFYHFQIRDNPKETDTALKPLFCQERAKWTKKVIARQECYARHTMCKPLSLGKQLKQEGFSTLQSRKKPHCWGNYHCWSWIHKRLTLLRWNISPLCNLKKVSDTRWVHPSPWTTAGVSESAVTFRGVIRYQWGKEQRDWG